MTTIPVPPDALLDGASLFLDLDGTLVDFAPTPDKIQVGENLRLLLVSLYGRLEGRLAVISGRSLEDLASHLEIDSLPMAGSHGLERRAGNGDAEAARVPDSVHEAIAEAVDFADRCGLLVEPKPAGVAIHFRDNPDAEVTVDAFVVDAAGRHGLLVQKGAMVRELRAPGRDKGDVVRAFMAEPPFNSGRPVVVGDDLTDEDAFAAARELGGIGVLVGDERDTRAQYRLPNVAAVREWLKG